MTVLDTNPADAYANDRKHVFHSWSAQGALSPVVVERAQGSDGAGAPVGHRGSCRGE